MFFSCCSKCHLHLIKLNIHLIKWWIQQLQRRPPKSGLGTFFCCLWDIYYFSLRQHHHHCHWCTIKELPGGNGSLIPQRLFGNVVAIFHNLDMLHIAESVTCTNFFCPFTLFPFSGGWRRIEIKTMSSWAKRGPVYSASPPSFLCRIQNKRRR